MRKPSVLLIILILCVFIAVPVAADDNTGNNGHHATPGDPPAGHGADHRTNDGTSHSTHQGYAAHDRVYRDRVPTVVTQPTTEPTITVAPTQPGEGKGYIDVYCNVDGASVYFNGNYEGVTSGGVLSVGVSPSGTPVTTILVSKTGYNS